MTCEEELRDLEPSRQTLKQQQRYLSEIAIRFQKIITYALKAQYECHQFLKNHEDLRLATLIVNFNLTFSENLKRREHAVSLSEIKLSFNKSF